MTNTPNDDREAEQLAYDALTVGHHIPHNSRMMFRYGWNARTPSPTQALGEDEAVEIMNRALTDVLKNGHITPVDCYRAQYRALLAAQPVTPVAVDELVDKMGRLIAWIIDDAHLIPKTDSETKKYIKKYMKEAMQTREG